MANLLDGANLAGQRITNLADPASAQDAATRNYVDVHAGALANGGTLPAGQVTATANTFYTVDASVSISSVRLPATPPQGSQVVIFRTDSTPGRSIPVSPGFGSTDSIADNFAAIYAGPGGFRFSYFGTTWYPEPIIGGIGAGYSPRAFSEPVAGTVVVRDGSGTARFADPIDTSDAATKHYVDFTAHDVLQGSSPYAYDYVTADTTLPTPVGGQFYGLDATNNNVTLTVPALVKVAATLRLARIDTNPAHTVTVALGAPATVRLDDGTFTSFKLGVGEYVEITYEGTDFYWQLTGGRVGNVNGNLGTGAFDPAATPGAAMVRDTAGRAQVVDPGVAADIATKNYVDTQATATKASATGVAAAMALVFGG